MKIFNTYTGNAMLNNALMTIEALGKLKSVSEISPNVLKGLYNQLDLNEVNKRLKSYTMVFSLNNPLVNPAKKTNNAGENTYNHLLNAIMDGYESDGDNICEISGLRFNKTFDEFYKDEIERQKAELVKKSTDAKLLNKELKNLENTDTSLNRSWFPLIGGLGSDAQALPQAKFSIQIHPICIPILQFLPLSALLYKGGILLVDSSNFELSRDFIARNVKTLAEKIQAVSTKESIENVRDFSKGDYLLKVLDILVEKEDMEESYSDLNMWSFSNSGTGASCDIDRVPNTQIRKLISLNKEPKIGNEFKGIMSRNESSYSFLECLEGNKDWWLLYPSVFGSGKKAVQYDGVSPMFLEMYYSLIGKSHLIPMAKYIAGLISKYKSKAFEKLNKTDSWNDPEYKVELFKVFIRATEQNEWSLEHQIAILDNNDELPVKNNYYQLHKLIHYYTQNEIYSTELQDVTVSNTKVFQSCSWLISLIQNDLKFKSIKSNLTNPQENSKVGYTRIIYDALGNYDIDLEEVVDIFYDSDFNFKKYGLSELLRIFFSQPQQNELEFANIKSELKDDTFFQTWKHKIQCYVNDYQIYFYAKYQNSIEGKLPHKKFEKTIDSLIKENDDFYSLLNETIYNTNQFLQEQNGTKEDKWSIDDLLTNPLGNSNRSICILTVKFLLKSSSIQYLKTNINL